MALSLPAGIFGVDSITFYNKLTGMPYGKVIEDITSININFTQELVNRVGGSNTFPWHVSRGDVTPEVSVTVGEYLPYMFELFFGANVTTNAAEASGNCSTLRNVSGTSAVDATTGIATATVKSGSESDLKNSMYVVKAVSATTVDVYMLAPRDRARGTNITIVSDDMKITSSPLTITASTAVEIPGTGIELTGGSGTIGMTTDDTAYFETRSINSGSSVGYAGSDNDCFVNFGMVVQSEIDDNGYQWLFEFPNVAGGGFPINPARKQYTESEIPMQIAVGTALDGTSSAFKYRHVNASQSCVS